MKKDKFLKLEKPAISMMRRYIKKPIEIEALEWTGENNVEVLNFCDRCYIIAGKELKISTLEGPMNASVGDFIIKGIQEEFYACKPDVFRLTYDEVTN